MEKWHNPLVDEYIASFPPDVQERMQTLRACIQKAAPQAEEIISYKMPAYKYKKVLVYFAGYKNHIGFYPTAQPMVVFAEDLAKYKHSKGAVQFPHDKPLPVALIKKMVKYREANQSEKQNESEE